MIKECEVHLMGFESYSRLDFFSDFLELLNLPNKL